MAYSLSESHKVTWAVIEIFHILRIINCYGRKVRKNLQKHAVNKSYCRLWFVKVAEAATTEAECVKVFQTNIFN